MLDFYQDKFRFVHELNLRLIKQFSVSEESNDQIRLLISKIINSRNITLSFLLDFKSESWENDLLPTNYWENFEFENFQLFEHFFESFRAGNTKFKNVNEIDAVLFASMKLTFELHGQLHFQVLQLENSRNRTDYL